MKKIVSVFAVTTMMCGLMACGNSKTPATGQVEEEQTATEVAAEQEAVDAEEADTSEAVTRGGTESEGVGRCLESGCYCKEFKGRGQTCRNCGHAYRRHY